jgi:uncharacterized protein YceH (UPF0502 family)
VAEQAPREAAARDAARLAALKAQQEREAAFARAAAELEASLVDRLIRSPDYKRRNTYYQQVFSENNSIVRQLEALKKAAAAAAASAEPVPAAP